MKLSDFQCHVSQGFGGALVNYYPLLGHPGTDVPCGYGTPVKAIADGVVYSLYTPEKPAYDGFTAIYTIVETPLETKEITYGHLSQIDVKIGDKITKGQVIGLEGNRGHVVAGGVLITQAMQKAGDKRGSHTHFQCRPIIKTKVTDGKMLQNAQGTYQDENGFFYKIAMPTNGYAGCVDLLDPTFNKDLSWLQTNYYVRVLQRALIKLGFLAEGNDTGYFGNLTKKAVQDFQRASGISPLLGYVGPITRTLLNTLFPNVP